MEHQPLRATDIRDRNEKLILHLMFRGGPTSQSQVVRITGLKAPTVFRIFANLESQQYIQPCEDPDTGRGGQRSPRKGRRPAYYCVVPDAAYAVGLDFSTAGVSVIVVNFANEVIHHESHDFPQGIQRDELLARLASMIGSALDECRIDPKRLVGVGIGAPGIVDTATGVVVEYSRIGGLTGCSLRDHFEAAFSVPVFVHNNASIIAASEHRHSPVSEYGSVLAVLVRGGVGGAFLNHGEIFVNGSITALELGRTSEWVPEDAVPGSAEAIAGAPCLETVVGEVPLLNLLQSHEEVNNWPEAQERLSQTRIAELIARPAIRFAVAVRNVYHVLHPEVVLVISRYEKLAHVLAAAVRGVLPEVRAVPVTYDPVKACYGATELVYRDFFSEQARVSSFTV